MIDALLLAHTDYLLKGTSALAEFSIWYSPRLATAHLDLQIEGEATKSNAYRRLVPLWAGGDASNSQPPEMSQADALEELQALRRPQPPPGEDRVAVRSPVGGELDATEGPRYGKRGRGAGRRGRGRRGERKRQAEAQQAPASEPGRKLPMA